MVDAFPGGKLLKRKKSKPFRLHVICYHDGTLILKMKDLL